MTPDHEAAKKYATEWITDLESRAEVRKKLEGVYGKCVGQLIDEGDTISRAYLDAMTRLDKATELLRAALGRSECYDEDHECGETDTTRAIRAFLSERKTNDKQS